MRTRFTLGGCAVRLDYDGYSGPVTETFHVPWRGGYIRDGNGRQVCARLDSRGPTLEARDPAHMLAIVRREWKLVNAADKRREKREAR